MTPNDIWNSPKYRTVPYGAVRYRTVLYGTVRYRTVPNGTVRHGTVRHRTALGGHPDIIWGTPLLIRVGAGSLPLLLIPFTFLFPQS